MKIFPAFRIAIFAWLFSLSTQLIAAPPLEAYGKLPDVEDIALSPSGERIATLMTIGGQRVIAVFDKDANLIHRVGAGDLKVRSLLFVDDKLLMVISSRTEKLGSDFIADKAEVQQALLLHIGSSNAQVVFEKQNSLISAIFGFYGVRNSADGPKAYFGAVELQRASTGSRTDHILDHMRPALYEVDLFTNRPRRVDASPPPGNDREWIIDAKGELLARMDMNDSTGAWKINNARGATIARGTTPTGRAWLMGAGYDGTTILYAAEDPESAQIEWYEVPADGSKKPEEFLPDIDVERTYWERGTGQLAGYLDTSGKPTFYNPETTRKYSLIQRAFSKFDFSLADRTQDFSTALLHTSGNADSGSYYLVNLSTLRANAIAYDRMDIPPKDVGPISTVTYKASDGLEMDGILTLPLGKEAEQLPLVMLPHGGPHSHDTEAFDWWAQAYASRGYAVFQPNFRGSTNKDEEFKRQGYGQWGRKMQTDLSDGVAHLVSQGIVDPKRVCIVGASYGGYAALAGVTMQKDIYRCAVSVAGVSDVSLMSRTDRRESGDSRIVSRSLEVRLGPSSEYKAISPRYHADSANAPILLIHGKDDTVVPFVQSEKMADALKDAGKPYEFVRLDGEDHWLSKGETRLAMLQAAVAFVEKHNPPE